MEYLDHLIDNFRTEHPECDADVLREFAGHVRRVLKDELREEMQDGKARLKLSMQINGMAFSADGPRALVEELLARWTERVERGTRNITPGLNRPQLISGRGR